MFNFFKSKDQRVREHFAEFNASFTTEQKAAVVGSLVVISKCDNHIADQEVKVIESVMQILDIEPDNYQLNRLPELGFEYLFKVLNSLDRNQKEWYVITVHNMIAADGKIEDVEAHYALKFCEKMGISEDEYISIVKRTSAIFNHLMG
jgi:uncharacterized tellurite resistance protein B-like protein